VHVSTLCRQRESAANERLLRLQKGEPTKKKKKKQQGGEEIERVLRVDGRGRRQVTSFGPSRDEVEIGAHEENMEITKGERKKAHKGGDRDRLGSVWGNVTHK